MSTLVFGGESLQLICHLPLFHPTSSMFCGVVEELLLRGGGCGRTVHPCPHAHSTSGFFLLTSHGGEGEHSLSPLPPLLGILIVSVHLPHTLRWGLFSLTHSPLRGISVVCVFSFDGLFVPPVGLLILTRRELFTLTLSSACCGVLSIRAETSELFSPLFSCMRDFLVQEPFLHSGTMCKFPY